MKDVFARGPLTDALLDYLEGEVDVRLMIGDGIAPKKAGWTGGQPGEGEFIPYVVLNTGTASRNNRDPLARDNSSWQATYTLRHVGALRQQTDWAADQVRMALVRFHPKIIDLGGNWRVLKSEYTLLGAVTRNDSTDPPYWELTDSVTLWLEAPLT